ncbi:hypothetical protein [Streptomyces sp. IBSBF 3136]|uniref:hypothetical protein n=1 Tax=Streptomyces sp. IBSBF 3136 TaxID=2903524 RepID=UPI002FDBDBB1
MSAVTTSHNTPHATAQPGRPTSANTAVPNTAQTNPHTLSHNRARRALRAVTGSLPVRIGSSLLLATYSPSASTGTPTGDVHDGHG